MKEPSSLDTTTISASFPPTSFQLVILPVYISFTWSNVKSFTLFAEFVITAIPSIAIWYSFNSDFSSSFKSLDDSINSVKIGGVEPKEENVYNDKYPISRPFLLKC